MLPFFMTVSSFIITSIVTVFALYVCANIFLYIKGRSLSFPKYSLPALLVLLAISTFFEEASFYERIETIIPYLIPLAISLDVLFDKK